MVHVVSVINDLACTSGGPSYGAARLSEATASVEVQQSMVTIRSAGPEEIPNSDLVRTVRVPGLRSRGLRFTYSNSFHRALRRHCQGIGANVIHCHGLWELANHHAAVVARELKVPLVISAHGMLAPWAMHHKAWKKRLAWWLYQQRDLNSAAMLRATADQEAKSIRQLGFTKPIAIIPHGIDMPDTHEPENGRVPRTVLFLGRIYPVKGLLNLVAAWSRVRPPGWRCVVAGPDEGGHQAEVQAALHTAGLARDFSFPGQVGDHAKWDLYRAADLFVLPSFTENFGLVVAEALAAGVPVITTKGTPWEELCIRQCGWWIDIGVEPLAAALREATSLSVGDLREMGKRGRCLVEEKFSWPGVGKTMLSAYQWILGKASRPSCVSLG